MKKITTSLLLLLGMIGLSWGQVLVTGTYTDGNGAPIPNASIFIEVSGGGAVYQSTTTTSPNGFFADSLASPGVAGYILVWANCGAFGMAIDTLPYSPNIGVYNVNLVCGQPSQGNCQAQFGFSQTASGQISFSDYSTYSGSSPTYLWDFGDGNTSTQVNPVHNYAGAGYYNVCLTIADTANGCFDTQCYLITVGGCVANFNAYQIFTGQVVFAADSLSYPGASFAWDFGDGNTGSGSYTTHGYANPGLYTVCLTVTDTASNCVATYCDSVLVTGSNPGGANCQAHFAQIWTGINTMTFYDCSNVSSSQGPITWSWDFGDGNTSTAQNPVHVYGQAGTYNVCLIIAGQNGCADTTCMNVVVPSGNPGCQAGFTAFPSTSGAFAFLADSNFAGSPVYTWDFGDGNTGTGQYTSHAYQNPGTYVVCLTVTDSILGCTATFCDSVATQTGGGGNCQAFFQYYQPFGTQVQFYAQQGQWNVAYSWDFGDGSTSTQPFPTHTYAQAGTYNVCLIVTNNSGCADTSCVAVVVQNLPACNANFYPWVSPNQPSQVHLYADSTYNSPSATYSWDFGDGTFGVGMYATHTYTNPGIYTICLTVTDSSSNCTVTQCDSVNIQGISLAGCNADFSWGLNATGQISFTDLSTAVDSAGNAIAITSWFWDFGDSTYSYAQNPTHTYTASGPFFVCLSIVDANGCASSVCDVVFSQTQGLSISGIVIADSNIVSIGTVYLIQHDSAANTLTLIDSVPMAQSYYQFNNVAPGTYLVKAALDSLDPNYANYLPTYLGDELFWYNATSTIVANSSVFNPVIFMIQGANNGGPGFIGGNISQGANKTGDNMQGVLVILMDENGNPIAYTHTDHNGNYSFDNLPHGTYHVHVEIPGLPTEVWTVIIGPGADQFTAADFEVNSTHVDAIGTTSIEQFSFGTIGDIYPNPVSQQLNIKVAFDRITDLELSVVNVMGQTLSRKVENGVVGERLIEWNVQDLAAGTYMLQLRAGGEVLSKRFIKNN
ncbi:MAG: PKD domain-containing protein [Bacteroidota bacterium]